MKKNKKKLTKNYQSELPMFDNGGFWQDVGDVGLNALKADANIFSGVVGYKPFQDKDFMGTGADFAKGASNFGSNLMKTGTGMAANMLGGPLAGQALNMAQNQIGSALNPVEKNPNMLYQGYEYGGIHIDPKNKGKFTASANSAGMGVQEFASKVLANKEDYSSTQVKRANFARNAAHFKHPDGGIIPDKLAFDTNKELPTNKQMLDYGYTPSPDSSQWINMNDPNAGFFTIKKGIKIPNVNTNQNTLSNTIQQSIDPNTLPLNLNMKPKRVGDSMGHVFNVYPDGRREPVKFQLGGINLEDANAEIEKEEVVRYPNGSTEQSDGPTHSNGGVPVNLPGGTEIYSDKLKASTGKTFAKEAEQYKNNKWDKIIEDKNSDPLRKKTAEMMKSKNNKVLDELFNEQETMKKSKAINAFNKFQKKYGGQMPMYAFGGPFNPEQNNFDVTGRANQNYVMQAPYYDNSFAQNQDSISNQQYIPSFDFQANSGSNSNTMNGPINPNYKESIPTVFGQTPNNNNKSTPYNWKRGAFETGNFIGQNIGNLAYLYDQGKDYDKVDYGNVTPEYLDPSRTLSDIDRSSYNTAKAIPGATGGQGGQALNYLLSNSTNRDLTKAGVREKYDNINAGIKNESLYRNQLSKMHGMQDEAANKGVSLGNYYEALSKTGENVFNANRDRRSEKLYENEIGTLPYTYNNPKLNAYLKLKGYNNGSK